jgi:tetratricopeptide (TPR) repeat protein
MSSVAAGVPPPSAPIEFERQMRVAWSCLKDVENKSESICKAKEAGDREVDEGTLRGTMAASALQGRLEKEFHNALNMAWNSAVKARQIDAEGSITMDDLSITPQVIFAGVSNLRGDLNFALSKWDEAIAFYTQALQYVPEEPGCYYNIGAAYTNKHDSVSAMKAFEQVIRLDPTGDLGIEATKQLENLNSGIIGRKAFSGSWKVLGVLGFLTICSFLSAFLIPPAGVLGLVFWGGLLALYWRIKFR